MKVQGVREFRARALDLIKGREPILITRHGRLVALLLPMENPEEIPVELRRELLVRIGQAIARDLVRKGVSEDQIQRGFTTWRKNRARARRLSGRRR
jgi:antitoxin (DNA-binding transcriptional repressor) of toxin-antitoxin stability system